LDDRGGWLGRVVLRVFDHRAAVFAVYGWLGHVDVERSAAGRAVQGAKRFGDAGHRYLMGVEAVDKAAMGTLAGMFHPASAWVKS
jgi:hypothetical protein